MPRFHHGSLPTLLASALVAACQSAPPEPEPGPRSTAPAKQAEPDPVKPPDAPGPSRPAPAAQTSTASGDPLQGKFGLSEAVTGLSGKGPLLATMKTDLGSLECTLYEDKAPNTVANFVGLARGLRPFKAEGGAWVKRPAYDGTTFHRVIKGFMIQGGDWQRTGRGDPGYVIPDEIWPGARHDRRGLLCMANKGKNTNGMQFFITDGVAAHLDGGYTIFGECGPGSVIDKLASVETQRDRPLSPPKIQSVSIARRTSPGAPKG